MIHGIRPFLLTGRRALDVLQQRADAALADWAAAWVTPPSALRSTVSSTDGAVPPAAGSTLRYSDGTGSVWIALDDAFIQAVADCALGPAFSPSATADGDWSKQVAAAAARALADTLAKALLLPDADAPAPGAPATLDTSLFAPGAGAVAVHCKAVSLRAWACRQALRHVPPTEDPRPTLSPLEPLARGLTRETVTLVASAGSVELELGRLLDLRAGDVLRLPTRLDDPLWIESPTGEPLARCALGRQLGHRAVSIQPSQSLAAAASVGPSS